MKVLATSALIPDNYPIRQWEYGQSFSTINQFGYDLYVVECYKEKGPSFFEEFSKNIFYSGVNANLKNKGVNEANALIKALEYFKFDPEELIVKITGRYRLENNSFFCDTDGFDCVYNPRGNQAFFGCFAIKAKLFYDMLNSFDKVKMEKEMINIEYLIARYLEDNNVKTKLVPQIGIRCNIANNGEVLV